MFSSLGKHFALFYSDNKHKMLVGTWSNAEEKGLWGLASKIFLWPRPPERRKVHLLKTEYSAGFGQFGV